MDDRYIERMLEVFLHARRLDKAVQLVIKKSSALSDQRLFQAVKQVSGSGNAKQKALVANEAYHLLQKSWYDKALIDIVLSYFKGSQEDWEELSDSLSNMAITDAGLDAAILKNAIWIHKADAEAQKIFVRVYRNDRGNAIIGAFAYDLIYEIMVRNLRVQYDTVALLENMYARFNDKLLAYALSHLYLNHGIETRHSESILQDAVGFMEEDGFLFPVFKAQKPDQDKTLASAYIEKNQAFMYAGLPDKNVFLYYKPDGEEEYRKQKMVYFRFGLYLTAVPIFYGETTEYYYSEEMPTGSVASKVMKTKNNALTVRDEGDLYAVINNALIYENMFKYEQVEAIITEALREYRDVKAELI